MSVKNACNISFCLPIYNVAPYLGDCLDSILSTKGVSFEIICVDDCSTDESLNILNEYAKKFSQIKVFSHEQNQGLSCTRNTCIENASGEYLWFVDSDDMIVPETVKSMFEIAKNTNADVITGNYENIVESNFVYKNIHDLTYDIVENKYYNISKIATVNEKGVLLFCVWASLFKREIISKEAIRYVPNLSPNEDNMFFYCFYYYANKIVKMNQVVYLYRWRPDSITNINAYDDVSKKNYLNSVFLLKTYNSFYSKGFYHSNKMKSVSCKRYLIYKISQSYEALFVCLFSYFDDKWAKEELKKIKKEGLLKGFFSFLRMKEHGFLRSIIYALLPLWPILKIARRKYKKSNKVI